MSTKPNSSYWKPEQKKKKRHFGLPSSPCWTEESFHLWAFISGAAVHRPVGKGGWGLVWTMENGTACVCPIQRNSN